MASMDYRRTLDNENSKLIWNKIIFDVGSDENKFSAVMEIFLSNDQKLIQRISQVIGVIGEKQPQLLSPYISKLINHLSLNPINAFKRNVLRAFQYTSIPNKVDGKLFDITLTFLKSNHEAIAVRVFSMTILRQICEKHPELSAEVGSTIEMILEENKSGGIQSRGKKELKKLKNLTTK